MTRGSALPLVTRGRVLVLVLLALASACVKPPPSGVAVKSVSTDLVFGIPPSPEPATPANTDLGPQDRLPIVQVPTFRSTATPRPVPTPIPPPPQCRERSPSDFPDEPASTTVKGKPKSGVSRWIVDGFQNVQNPPLGKVPLPKVTRRSVFAVTEGSGGAFTYTLEEKDLSFASSVTVQTTYQVLPETTAGRDPGIYLTKIVRMGQQTRTFTPQPPVLYLPMPVRIGQPPIGPGGTGQQDQIDSVGVDPTTLEVLHNVGNVTKRVEVDACGEVLQAWFVDGTQEFASGSSTFQRNYDYAIATQIGGLLIFEHIETPCATANADGTCTPPGDLQFNARLGQVQPDPLPAGKT